MIVRLVRNGGKVRWKWWRGWGELVDGGCIVVLKIYDCARCSDKASERHILNNPRQTKCSLGIDSLSLSLRLGETRSLRFGSMWIIILRIVG